MRNQRVWIIRGGIALLLVAVLVWAFRPQPIAADMAEVRTAPFEVFVRDDGFTRVREVYTVSAPLAGRVLRLSGEAGDTVFAGETTLANILPADPAMPRFAVAGR